MNRRQFLKSTATLGLVAAGSGAVYGNTIERWAFDVTRYEIPGPTRMRIAFMSDLHRSWTTSRAFIAEAVAACNAQHPDVVLLGGDYISDDAKLAHDCGEELSRLRAPLGVFFVLGNHDGWHHPDRVRAALSRGGLQELTDASTRLGNGVALVGLDDFWTGKPDPDRAFRGTDGQLRVAFSHNPKIFPRVRDRGCILICGHTHGGQIVIPGIPNPYMQGWTTYVKGWFDERGSRMYVNRGIGTLRIPMRINCPPEITLLDVTPT